MQQRRVTTDVVVVGGGLAGVSAAVAAARLGSTVALVTNRPVLGGNSSSEVRVWVVGATAHGNQKFARETGVMGELFLENQYRNAEGNPHYWDQVVLDLVRAEPRINLHLNTDVRSLTMNEGGNTIASVTGWTMGSEIETTFEAPAFLDCTGDGLVGHLAGANYRIGREARSEFNEEWAPEQADDELLGSSIFFYTKDAGQPSRFVPPRITKDVTSTPILANRIIRTGDNGCHYWWIEWGGELDTVTDNEKIRDELWGVVFGIWDHIKNSGAFDADRLTLEWVGSIPGKREYRRFVGDHTLTQNDILGQVSFPDAVAYGGWSIDLHPVEGVYAEEPGAQQRYSAGTYDIPYRSLYSHNVSNLFFAGRNISASHVAFGSTRVMATCSALGQAAGTAASLIAELGLTPRQLGTTFLNVLRRTLLREDAPVVGLRVEDPDDLSHFAKITASSTLEHLAAVPHPEGSSYPLDRDVALILPADPGLDSISFAVDSESDAVVPVELWGTGNPQTYAPIKHLKSTTANVAAGHNSELTATFDWRPESAQNAVVLLRATRGVSLKMSTNRPYGVLALEHKQHGDPVFDDHIDDEHDQPVTDWVARKLRRRSFAFEASPSTRAYGATRVADGYQRPFGGPHLWSSTEIAESRNLREQPETLELTWPSAVLIASVRIVFNDDVDEDLVNLHHHRTGFDVVPELVTDYRIETRVDGTWRTVAAVADNRHRHRIHDFDPVDTDALRLVALGTAGARFVMVHSVKTYAEPSRRNTSS